MEPLLGKLASVEARFQEIERLMARPEVAMDYAQIQTLAKERASLEELVSMYRGYCKALKERQDALAILKEGAEAGMTSLASQELEILNGRLEELGQRLRLAILPRDPNDDKDVIVEVREGVGGKEAALFAADLYRMYTRYAVLRNWEIEALNSSPSGLGGFKEIVFEVRGKGAFSRLKHERGAHRVQRVPVTEASGRIHTSTATVAVLPEADEVDVRVNQDDLRIDIFHAGGHGGQNVNKVATAVRIVHNPSGLTVVCQDERSQHKNKQRAMAMLRARLFEAEQERHDAEISQARRSQVGGAERAEKIRTYNYPQDRVTDHRSSTTFHGIPRLMDGYWDDIVDRMVSWEEERLLAEAGV
jgi:peptide chain release factor 1